MKKSFLYLLTGTIALVACVSNPSKTVDKPEARLEFLWQTDTIHTTCESVKYDSERTVVYVSNINENPWGKDGNGFISKIDTLGNTIDYQWITGLDAPKGMGIWENTLYIANIDQVVEVDIEKGEIIKRHLVPNNPTLNDIAVSDKGIVYITGSDDNTFYKLENDSVQIIKTNDYGRLNGLLYEDGNLLFLTTNSQIFGHFNLQTLEHTILLDSIGKGDGLVAIGNGDYLTSSWAGEIFYIYSKDWSKKRLLDTRSEKINQADFDYIPETKMLIVPTFFNNRVVAYRLVLNK